MFCTSFNKVLHQNLAVIDVVANSCLLHAPAHTDCQAALFKIRDNTVHNTEAFLFETSIVLEQLCRYKITLP